MDEKEVRRTIEVFLEPQQITEVRIPKYRGGNTHCRCFAREEIDELCQWVAERDDAAGIYFVPNPLKEKVRGSASDHHVRERRWLLIDFDPVRKVKVSSTDDEKYLSYECCMTCWRELSSDEHFNVLRIVCADSGNGYHLLLPWQDGNTDEARWLAKNYLRNISRRYSTDKVNIDTGVFNAARICKLYGTMSRKGESTDERPHRCSRIIDASTIDGNRNGTTSHDWSLHLPGEARQPHP